MRDVGLAITHGGRGCPPVIPGHSPGDRRVAITRGDAGTGTRDTEWEQGVAEKRRG